MRSLLASLLALSACATYQSQLDQQFLGHKVDDVVIAWGPPTSTYKLESGGQVMEWMRDRGEGRVEVAGITSTAKHWCATRAVTDAGGVVVKIDTHGNYCPS